MNQRMPYSADRRGILRPLWLLVLFLLSWALEPFESKADDTPPVILEKVAGKVTRIRRFIKTHAHVGMSLNSTDMLVSGRDGNATLRLADGSTLKMGNQGRLKVRTILKRGKARNTEVELLAGMSFFDVKPLHENESFSIRSPAAVTGVRGTRFFVSFEKAQGFFRKRRSTVSVVSGRVEVFPVRAGGAQKGVSVGAMQMTSVSGGGAPETPKAIPPGELSKLITSSGLGDTKGGGVEGLNLETLAKQAPIQTSPPKPPSLQGPSQQQAGIRERPIATDQLPSVLERVRQEIIRVSRPPEVPNER